MDNLGISIFPAQHGLYFLYLQVTLYLCFLTFLSFSLPLFSTVLHISFSQAFLPIEPASRHTQIRSMSMNLTTHTTPDNPLDLLIVGAGISGIDLAYHIHMNFPQWAWYAVDSNTDIGGTWTTFRYPGIRSDSDMATFAFPFKPWPHSGTLGSAQQIRTYARGVAKEVGLLDRLQLCTWVQRATFHTSSGLWSIQMAVNTHAENMAEGGAFGSLPHSPSPTQEDQHSTSPVAYQTVWARRIHFASGYYRHSSGFTANIPGLDYFQGTTIHPQNWPEDIDVRAKKIVVIGSGATAITLIPALHTMGADTTMLQRTPTYVAPLMETDAISTISRALLPSRYADKVARSIHIRRDMTQYHLCQKLPALAKGVFWLMNRQYISAHTIKEHFTPPYNPWDQRVCKAPDGDIFRAINAGAKVVTAHIAQVQANGILLTDGRFLPADIIVTATGLQLQAFGGAEIAVDDTVVPMKQMLSYRGVMMNRLPNFSYTIGYLNQSWTLRADMTSRYLVAVWKDCQRRSVSHYCPVVPDDVSTNVPLLEMESGYIQRSVKDLPRQGDRAPWRMKQDYVQESRHLLKADNTEDMVYGADAVVAAGKLTMQVGVEGSDAVEPPSRTERLAM